MGIRNVYIADTDQKKIDKIVEYVKGILTNPKITVLPNVVEIMHVLKQHQGKLNKYNSVLFMDSNLPVKEGEEPKEMSGVTCASDMSLIDIKVPVIMTSSTTIFVDFGIIIGSISVDYRLYQSKDFAKALTSADEWNEVEKYAGQKSETI